MSIYETILLRTKLVDINAQPNLFHRSFYDSLTDAPKDFSLDLYFLYMAQKKNRKSIGLRSPSQKDYMDTLAGIPAYHQNGSL